MLAPPVLGQSLIFALSPPVSSVAPSPSPIVELPPSAAFFNFGQCAFSFVPSSYLDWKQRVTLLPPEATKQLSRHPYHERIFSKADLALPASPPA